MFFFLIFGYSTAKSVDYFESGEILSTRDEASARSQSSSPSHMQRKIKQEKIPELEGEGGVGRKGEGRGMTEAEESPLSFLVYL